MKTILRKFVVAFAIGLTALGGVWAGLETGTYINSLVNTNPTASDPVSQADDHLRLVKSTILSTFPNITGAVTATHSQLNQVFTAGTAQASTAGTSIDFTSIPSWVKRVTIVLSGVSTSGTSNLMVQVGDSGGVETTGYLGSATNLASGPTVTSDAFTTGFGVTSALLTTSVVHSTIVLNLVNSATNTWAAAATGSFSDIVTTLSGGGSKSLSATLDRVRITTVGGSDTFDAGTINILYE